MSLVAQLHLYMAIMGLGIIGFLIGVARTVIGGVLRDRAAKGSISTQCQRMEDQRAAERHASIQAQARNLVEVEQAAEQIRRTS